MAYHPLAQQTGSDGPARRKEADRILKIIREDGAVARMTDSEQTFINGLSNEQEITPKQLFWLRDLKAKYCE